MKPKAQIILALDVDDLARARYFVNKLYPKIISAFYNLWHQGD
ncbi:MAG: hypothetical protein NTW13_04710 [Candidatus Omnitrophica bacterium]|nr:hypothetical protein [Candidatus Omnitrophota bacterium]